MIRIALPLLFALSACGGITKAVDDSSRSAAKSVIPEALALYFPEVPKELFTPFTNCIVANATTPEAADLAQDAVVGADPGTGETIRTILARPATADCLKSAVPETGTTI